MFNYLANMNILTIYKFKIKLFEEDLLDNPLLFFLKDINTVYADDLELIYVRQVE